MTPRVRAVEIHEEEAQKIRRVMQRRKEGEGGGRRGKNLLISGISPESRPTDRPMIRARKLNALIWHEA